MISYLTQTYFNPPPSNFLHNQVKNVIAEKTAMASMNHPFVLKLYNTFQDKDQLCVLHVFFGVRSKDKSMDEYIDACL